MTPRKAGAPLLDQLAERGRAISAANQRARAVELEHDRAQAGAERLKAARIDALASGDDQLAEKLQTQRVESERAAGDLGDRLVAARLAAKRSEGDRQQFAERNIDGLLAEHEAAAQAAADAVTAALDAVEAAVAGWRASEATTLSLLRFGGRAQERPAALPSVLVDLVRQISRLNVDIPAPLPGGYGVVRQAPAQRREPAVR